MFKECLPCLSFPSVASFLFLLWIGVSLLTLSSIPYWNCDFLWSVCDGGLISILSWMIILFLLIIIHWLVIMSYLHLPLWTIHHEQSFSPEFPFFYKKTEEICFKSLDWSQFQKCFNSCVRARASRFPRGAFFSCQLIVILCCWWTLQIYLVRWLLSVLFCSALTAMSTNLLPFWTEYWSTPCYLHLLFLLLAALSAFKTLWLFLSGWYDAFSELFFNLFVFL